MPINSSRASKMNTPVSMAGDFRPHLERYRDAVLLAVASAAAMGAGLAMHQPLLGGIGAALAGLGAYKRFQDGQRRHRGLKVENTTLDGLQRQCDERGWGLKTDLAFKGLGNLDGVVTTASMICIVEIKSYGGLTVRGQRVVRTNKDATRADKELRQAQQQGQRVRGYLKTVKPVLPVLWCPASRREAGVVHDGVLLANGSVELMCEFIAEMDSAISAAVSGSGR